MQGTLPKTMAQGGVVRLSIHQVFQLTTHHPKLGLGPLARPTCHVAPPSSQHGNIVPHLGHRLKLHVRIDFGEVLKGDVRPSLIQCAIMRANGNTQRANPLFPFFRIENFVSRIGREAPK